MQSRPVVIASYVLIAATLLLVMWQGLLPGLLCVCIGFLATRWLARVLENGVRRTLPTSSVRARAALAVPRGIAAALIMLAPIGLIAVAFSEARDFVLNAPSQYLELIDYIARTVLELRQKLPTEIAAYLPEGADEVQRVLANYLRTQAGALALTGRAWLGGLLFAYVGLIVGALAAIATPTSVGRPLAEELKLRITRFGEAFQQIVAAQFWIAAFNALLTALFLLFVLPMWDLALPYAPALITLTFVAGLVPIVGNLLCNTVITLVGLSVSPIAALVCLAFLILIHKAEYFINAKVVGSRTRMSVWELLAVMFVAEAVFGPAGLVAAPLFYAYLKKELQAAELV
ncbi:MAG: AI-2E family transporter [Gammaproteobacteria bacterium]|nr:AI-2E family transporter [Gammaproteobacteria bacterium]MBU1442913.1 AI-2E family transporter [Gammaproteobacteria bacterium]MBU2408008.1 AI-2E family transporter [Gammaproteobacteria bacterium]